MRVGGLLSGEKSVQRGLHRLSLSVLDECLFVVQRSLIISASRFPSRWRREVGITWVKRGVVDKFDALIFETFVEPICTELENVSWPFTVDGAV